MILSAASFGAIAVSPITAAAQIDDICREFGYIATLEAPRLTAPFVYGRITFSNADAGAKLPVISISYQNRGATPERITVSRSGNYCFRITGGSGGTLIVESDGIEVARRQVSSFGAAQQREDFEVVATAERASDRSGVVAGKFYRPPNERTTELYRQAAVLEEKKDSPGVIALLEQILQLDPEDFVAWGLLGNFQLDAEKFDIAEASIRKAIGLREDYTPAWVTAGMIRIARKQYETAVVVLRHAVSLEPNSARIYQLLGEAYLLGKQGNLGAEALNKAIELDPIKMAECHLQLAHLYQLAKANQMAAEEYRKFLKKVPDHPEREKFEKFIKDNL